METVYLFSLVAIILTTVILIFKYLKSRKRKPDKKSRSEFGLLNLSEFHMKSFNLTLPPKFTLVTDLDGTLIGNKSQLSKFNEIWLSKYAPNNCLLIYATGRSYIQYTKGIYNEDLELMKPDLLICKDGITIYWLNNKLTKLIPNNKLLLTKEKTENMYDYVSKDKSWNDLMNENWNQKFIENIQQRYLELYKDKIHEKPFWLAGIEPYRVSVSVNNENDAKHAIKWFETEIKLYKEKEIKLHSYYSELKDYNCWFACFMPIKAGKGNALKYCIDLLGIKDQKSVIVCGDSGNDISMMDGLNYSAVIMGNSAIELKRFYDKHKNNKSDDILMTKGQKTDGVLEGLHHFSSRNLKANDN